MSYCRKSGFDAFVQSVGTLKIPKHTSSFKDFKELDTSSPNFMSQPFAESKEDESGRPKDLLENRVDGLYVCLISLHGLVRGERMELGKDPDTGGQVAICCYLLCLTEMRP